MPDAQRSEADEAAPSRTTLLDRLDALHRAALDQRAELARIASAAETIAAHLTCRPAPWPPRDHP